MNISRSQRLEALAHPDFFVRSTMLRLMAGENDRDPETTRHAITAVERYGWAEAFEYSNLLSSLSLDEASMQWLVEQISDRSGRGPSENTRYHLQSWFARAPLELLGSKMDQLGLTSRPLSKLSEEYGVMTPLGVAHRRLELRERSADECLALLDHGFRQSQAAEKFPHRILSDLDLVCEWLASTEFDAAGLVQDWLSFDFGCDLEQRHWRSGIAIHLAGLCKLESAAPRLIQMLEYDWDWWNERIPRALQAIGTPTVLRTTIESYPSQPWHGRLFLSSVFEKLRIAPMHTDLIRLLRPETDDRLRVELGVALAGYGDSESMVHAQRVYDEHPGDPERFHIAEILYAFRTMLGERGGLLQEWRERQEFQRRREQAAMARFGPPPAPASARKKAGRNDPCPCGSGKKFKKCCLPQMEAHLRS